MTSPSVGDKMFLCKQHFPFKNKAPYKQLDLGLICNVTNFVVLKRERPIA